ncbi:hypothetical protein LR48_Vigan09g047600 [Vigna angularis]|uniref:Uncharacterized protein n=1 Tax=Phaseolus angularis TaxID=3914 RepID=A0A0L9VA55_PHAAN|nr:hypothetical protein LR48_Vigan09g047600 [Vigna angularis]
MIRGDDQRKISQGGPEEEDRKDPLMFFRLLLYRKERQRRGSPRTGKPMIERSDHTILIDPTRDRKGLLTASFARLRRARIYYAFRSVLSQQEFDWIETRGAYTSKVSLAQQFLETKAKVLFRSQGVHYLLLLAIPMPMPMIERLGEYANREERDRKHKVASEASGESNERVRIGPITLTQGESIAWFAKGRKGLGLDGGSSIGSSCNFFKWCVEENVDEKDCTMVRRISQLENAVKDLQKMMKMLVVALCVCIVVCLVMFRFCLG